MNIPYIRILLVLEHGMKDNILTENVTKLAYYVDGTD